MPYWINTVSRDHVLAGKDGGFTQANHGRKTTLGKLAKGDLIAFYSPRTGFREGEKLQRFTALARVTDEEPYQVEMTPDFHPWRRDVAFLPCEEAPIRPLIDALDFIRNKKNWGFPFRRGLFKIDAEDFERIARAMQAEITREG